MRVLISLSGAHQVLKADRSVGTPSASDVDLLPLGHNLGLETLEVGDSPVDLVLDRSGETAVTADAMSATLTLGRVADLSLLGTAALAPDGSTPPTEQRA